MLCFTCAPEGTSVQKQHKYQKWKRSTQGRNGAEPGSIPAQCHARYSGSGEVQFICRVPHAPRTRLPQVSVRLGTALPLSQQLSNLPAVFPAARIYRLQFCLACSLKSSALMRPWRCDSTLESQLDLPNPFIVSSSFDFTIIGQPHAASTPSSRRR